MIEIKKRHMVGGTGHEHIAAVKYLNAEGLEKEATRQAMVDWLNKSTSNKAIVYSRDRNSSACAYVVTRENAPDYIRTKSDSKWTDNLLALDAY